METLYPLSYVQKMHLLEQSYDINSPHMNIGGYMVIEGMFDLVSYRKAIRKVIEDNAILRTIFVRNGDNHFSQQVSEEIKSLVFKDFSSEINPDQSCKNWVQLRMSTPFDIQNSKPWEMGLLLAGERSYCYSIYHHIIADGWSIALTQYEIAENYINLLKGNVLRQTTISFFDFLFDEKEYFNSIKYKEDKKYWKDKAKEIGGYSSDISYKKRNKKISDAITRDVAIEHDLYSKIIFFCNKNNLTVFHFFITIFLLIIKTRTGNDKVLLNIRVHNRSSKKQKCSLGPFSSIIPVTADFNSDDIFIIFNQISRELKESYRHQKCALQEFYPAAVSEGHDLSGAMVFSYEPNNHDYFNGLFSAEAFGLSNGKVSDSLAVYVRELHKENRVFVSMHFDVNLFSAIETEIYIEQFNLFINQIVCNGITKVDDMEFLTRIEKDILNKINNTDEILLKDNLCSVLEDVFYAFSDDTAVVCDNKKFSYKELFNEAYKVAGYLQNLKVGIGDIVAVKMDYSFEMIVALTGIFLSKAVFVPVSNKDPVQRIRKILNDSEARLFLVDNFCELNCDQVLLKDVLIADKVYERKQVEIDDNAPCYIVYTSGSTGEPKGVINTHRAVVNVLEDWIERYKIVVGKFILLQTSSFAHDVFMGNYLKTIATGGIFVLPTGKERLDLNKLAVIFKNNLVNTLDSTPSLVMMIVEHMERMCVDDDSLKLIIVGSDICSLEDFKKLFIKYKGRAVVVNSYGVSEAAIYSTDYSVGSEEELPDNGNLPIGKPYKNTKMYVLNDKFKSVSLGCIGELYISGYGLASGYTSKELINEKFFELPGIGRVYQTGDLARVMSDGNIQFIGRKDFQIKIRGYRIEPGEIEDCINKIEGINKVAVVASEVAGNKVLVAYYSSRRSILIEELLFKTRMALPDYMVPMFFKKLGEFPLSLNGKVDRKKLMSLEIKNESRVFLHENTGEDKICVKEVWMKILGVRFNSSKSFSEMGGDSLEAIKIASELNSLGFKCSYMDIYKNFSFDDFFETFIEEKKVTELSKANNLLLKVYGKGVELQYSFNEKFGKRVINLKISSEKLFLDSISVLDFCNDRLSFAIQPQYLFGKDYPVLDADKVKNVLSELYAKEKTFLNSFVEKGSLYRLEDPLYSSNLRRFYRNVYFVTNLRFEEKRTNDVREAVKQLMNKNDLLKACLIKTGLGKYVWEIYPSSENVIPVIDLSEFEVFSSYDFMHTVLREYFLRKNDFRKFLFRAVIVKINLSEAYLWWFMDDSIHDDFGNQLIEKYLYQVTRSGYKNYPMTSSYKDFLEHFLIEREISNEEDLMKRLDLKNFEKCFINYKQFIKENCKKNKRTNTFCFNFSTKDEVKDEFKLAIEVFVFFAKNHFPFKKVPIFLLHNTRFFDSDKFANTIGAFIDEVPLIIDTDLSVEENVKNIQTKLEYVNTDGIHFKSILLNNQAKNNHLRKKANQIIGQLMDNDSLLLFNFKQGDIHIEEIFTETEGIAIYRWLYGITFNVTILDGRCYVSIRIPYKVDFSVLKQKFYEQFGKEE